MDALADVIGTSMGMLAIQAQVRRLLGVVATARRVPPVLLRGETGTGKGLLARSLHAGSPRASGRFVSVNCAAIPETLLEAELFGFERGAFTDARQSKPGLFQEAHGGTLFLDEVGLLPESLQAKLLTALDDRAVRRLGGTRMEPTDCWVIAATSTDLEQGRRERRFREDLYHRLSVFTITLPPLRERGDDVLLLSDALLQRLSADYGFSTRKLDETARAALARYPWPGNVRELANVLERAALLSESAVIDSGMLGLPEDVGSAHGSVGTVSSPSAPTLRTELGGLERSRLVEALERSNWNISLAAEMLGVPRNTLRYRIEKHRLVRPDRPMSRSDPPNRVERPASSARHRADRRPAVVASIITPRRRTIAFLRASLTGPPMSGWETSHARSLITEKIESFGGRVVQHHDTGVDGAFGLEPTEDASARAAYAALAIRRMTERAGAQQGDIGLKLAIETLTCVVREGVDRQTSLASESLRAATHGLTALLETTDLGSIAVGPGAVSHLARQFSLAPPVGDRHRGITLLVRRDGTRPGRGLPMQRSRTPFVGRTQELAFLEERLRQVAATGRGHVVGLMGEPGIGKSRLLDEFHRTLTVRGAVVFEGRCNAHVRSPYAAVTDLLRRAWLLDAADDVPSVVERIRTALQQLGLEPPMLSPYLHPLLGVASGSEVTTDSGEVVRARTYQALEQVLRAYAKSGPLVVLLEDIHWMDRLSEAFVASFVDTLPGIACPMALTTRPGHRAAWLDRSWASQLALPPLALPESRVIAQAVLPPASDDAIVEQIARRGEGNPFFVEELAGAVEGYTATGVPATVTAALEARMDRLRSDACRVLESAAVIGREVSARLLAAVTNQSTGVLAASLRELVAAEFLYERPVGLYVFKHALTQAVAYDRLAPPERRRLHAAAGQAVEQLHAGAPDAVAAELAHHAVAAENWERAHRYLRASAMQASRASAFLEATQMLEHALEALQKLSPSRERSHQQFDTMLELWTAYFESSQYARIPQLERALEPLGRQLGQQAQLAGLLVRRAQFLWGRGRPGEVIATVADVLRCAAPDDVRTRGYAHFLAGSASRDAGSFGDAFAAFAAGAQLVGGLGPEHPDAPVILPILANIHAWRSEAHAVLGRHEEARNAAEEAVTLARSVANDSGLVFGKAFLGYALVLHGDVDAALPVLEEAFSHFPPGQLVNAALFAAAFLAYALALGGQHARAISLLERHLPLPPSETGRLQTTRYRSATAAAYLAAHRADRALQELDFVLPIARAADVRGHLPTLLRLRAEALLQSGSGELAEIRALLLEARDLASSVGLEPESARCLAVLGHTDICAGMVASGRELLGRARVAMENLGMHFWVRHVEMEIDNA